MKTNKRTVVSKVIDYEHLDIKRSTPENCVLVLADMNTNPGIVYTFEMPIDILRQFVASVDNPDSKPPQYAISIKNDNSTELWGPYENVELAQQVKDVFIGVPKSATIEIVPVNGQMNFTGRPE